MLACASPNCFETCLFIRNRISMFYLLVIKSLFSFIENKRTFQNTNQAQFDTSDIKKTDESKEPMKIRLDNDQECI